MLTETLEELNENHFPYTTIEEAFNLETLKLATNDDKIIYIIDIPITHQQKYDVLTLKTNKLSTPTLGLQYHKILYNHENIFGMKETYQKIIFVNKMS